MDWHTLLGLVGCLYALQATLPARTRSALHRCLERRGISRLPGIEGDKPAKKQKFNSCSVGTFMWTSPKSAPKRQTVTSFFHMTRVHFSSFGSAFATILADNGPCSRDRHVQMLLNRQHICQRCIKPYTPRTHGKAERFIQTALRE